MGRTYWFECSKCGYQAKVAGRADRGVNFFVQTIVCNDCRALYDAVTRIRVPDESKLQLNNLGLRRPKTLARRFDSPPSFEFALNRLPQTGPRSKWVQFKLQCPKSSVHRVQSWTEPNRCPKCGVFLERSALPFRLWD